MKKVAWLKNEVGPVSLVLAFGLVSLVSVARADHQSIAVKVNGMVCAFCAQGIEKKFAKEKSVAKVDVNLGKHSVVIHLAHQEGLSDDRIKSLLQDSGFSVDAISRN